MGEEAPLLCKSAPVEAEEIGEEAKGEGEADEEKDCIRWETVDEDRGEDDGGGTLLLLLLMLLLLLLLLLSVENEIFFLSGDGSSRMEGGAVGVDVVLCEGVGGVDSGDFD